MSELRSGVPDFRAMVDCKAVSPVKRCLFGEPDHGHVKAVLVKQLALIIKQDSEKYNFDFVNGQPLQGRFEWEKIEPNTQAQTRDSLRTPAKESEYLHATNFENTTLQKKVARRCVSKTKSSKCTNKPDEKQLTLTDMFPRKKRGSLVGESGSSLKRQFSETLTSSQDDLVSGKRSCCRQT